MNCHVIVAYIIPKALSAVSLRGLTDTNVMRQRRRGSDGAPSTVSRERRRIACTSSGMDSATAGTSGKPSICVPPVASISVPRLSARRFRTFWGVGGIGTPKTGLPASLAV